MQPDFSFRSLTTGCNGQGISAVVTAGEISLESIDNIELREFRTTSIAARCIINAGDSVQRSCNENRIKLNKVNCVVVSSMAPHHVSGLAGLIQSMSDLGVGTLTIIGPAGLLGLLANMKSFVNRKYGMALVLFLVIILLSISYLCNIYIYIYILFCTAIFKSSTVSRYPVIAAYEIGVDGNMEPQTFHISPFSVKVLPIFAESVILLTHSTLHLTLFICLSPSSLFYLPRTCIPQ